MMVANTNSNSSPPLRGRGLLADDDKKTFRDRIYNILENIFFIVLFPVFLFFEIIWGEKQTDKVLNLFRRN